MFDVERKDELGKEEHSQRQKVQPSIDDITRGEDITPHYLDENKKFKIYRYNKEVYAVRCDEHTSNPIDFVHMWNSHKGEQKGISKEQQESLGSGVAGTVYKKTEDKAVKVIHGRKANKERDIERNLDILEQKFLLKEHNIEEYFVSGLWSIKDKDKVFFFMPKVDRTFPKDFNKDQLKPMFDEFILALKKLNELGYSHPDLAIHHRHTSPQNMLITPKGVRLCLSAFV